MRAVRKSCRARSTTRRRRDHRGAWRLRGDTVAGQRSTRLARRANEVLVGFSDITALHAQWARGASVRPRTDGGWRRSRHGSAGRTRAQHARGRFVRELPGLRVLGRSGERAAARRQSLRALRAARTPFMPDLRGAILLLEDVGERPTESIACSRAAAERCARGRGRHLAGSLHPCEPGSDG